MAPPLVQLNDIHLSFGGTPLLQGAELLVAPGDRLCMVGRNGSGKSTLMKIAAELVEADAGERFIQPGATVRYLPQEPDMSGFDTVLAYVEAGLAPGDDLHVAARLLEQLSVDPAAAPASLSGGEGRRAALARPKYDAIHQMEDELARLESGEITPAGGETPERRIAELRETLARARDKRSRIPFIDPIDLRYNRMEYRPQPIAQAVMFCLMDVSASMDEEMKGLAKRFFLLLHLFLERHYDNVDVVFIRHTQHAEEVDEQTFFEGRQTGGTVVSSALKEMLRIANARYPTGDYNIYVAQASDGDNVRSDIETCVNLLNDRILPMTQYMAYVEINPPVRGRRGSGRDESDLWHGYSQISGRRPNLAMRRISEAGDIFPVFRDLFKSEVQTS
jgi:hypothetical protein